MTDIKDTLVERATTHGDFDEVAFIAQHIKLILRNGQSWDKMNNQQKEALEMIASKLARVVSGNPNEPDHMHDAAGYSKLYNQAIEDFEIDNFLNS